jgi:hypothetical protein
MQPTTVTGLNACTIRRSLTGKRTFRGIEMFWRAIVPAVALIGCCAVLPTSARAGCSSSSSRPGLALALPFQLQGNQAAPDVASQSPSPESSEQEHRRVSITGFWSVTFYTNGKVWDLGYDQFSSDGNELMVDIVPPSLGNVCVGVWKRIGDRIYKIVHKAWDFDANGQLIGKGELLETITVDADGNSYHGSFVGRDYDLLGNQVDETKGELKADRITVN